MSQFCLNLMINYVISGNEEILNKNKTLYALFHILGEMKLVQNSVENIKIDGSSLEKINSWMGRQSRLFNNKQ